MGKVIAKAWSDAEFKARLLANSAETLQAEGIEIPAGVKAPDVRPKVGEWPHQDSP